MREKEIDDEAKEEQQTQKTRMENVWKKSRRAIRAERSIEQKSTVHRTEPAFYRCVCVLEIETGDPMSVRKRFCSIEKCTNTK